MSQFHLSSCPTFLVMQFSLGTDSTGQPAQKSRLCGSYRSVEEAFDCARQLAAEKWCSLPEGDAANAKLVDTEWGYDLRCGHLTVHRFWVHDKAAGQLV